MINNWPADKIEKRDIETLIPYARNAKKHPEAQLLKIAASIKEWGWTNPVLIDSSGGIIAGHGRVAAAQKLGIKEIPVMVAEGWSQAKIKAYCIADNKLAESEWDEEILALELQELGEMDFDLELLGFDETELDLLLGDDESNLNGNEENNKTSLADRFLIPPFSVLNAREGWWQDRKRAWLALGIKSELGRGGG